MKIEQTFSLRFFTNSSSQRLRILKVCQSGDEINVLAKLSSPLNGIGTAAIGEAFASVTTEVENREFARVRYYVLGCELRNLSLKPEEVTVKDSQGVQHRFTAIVFPSDFPTQGKFQPFVTCYENEHTLEREQAEIEAFHQQQRLEAEQRRLEEMEERRLFQEFLAIRKAEKESAKQAAPNYVGLRHKKEPTALSDAFTRLHEKRDPCLAVESAPAFSQSRLALFGERATRLMGLLDDSSQFRHVPDKLMLMDEIKTSGLKR